jgi:hypothetical protein
MTERQLVTDAEALEHRYSILIQGAASGWTELMDFADRLLSTRAALIAMVQELDDALGYHRNEITAQDKARALLADLHGERP